MATHESMANGASGPAKLGPESGLGQRSEGRVAADFPVEVRLGSTGAVQWRWLAQAVDLSSRGMLIEVPELLPLRTRLDLAFRPLPNGLEVSMVGEVVRSTVDEADRRLVGVCFVVVRKEARLAMRDALRALREGDRAAGSGPGRAAS
jgi:hypothetical protein